MGQVTYIAVNFSEAIFLLITIMVAYSIIAYFIYRFFRSYRTFTLPLLFLIALYLFAFSSESFVVFNPAVNTTIINEYSYSDYSSVVSLPSEYTQVMSAFLITMTVIVFIVILVYALRMLSR